MPIEIITGKPGNGKTALMMERLLQEAAKAERPLFAAGIDGLRDGLATVLDDPRKWNAIRPGEPGTCNCTAGPEGHSHVVPEGSLIFVDEAWKWFGHLHDASRQATPPHVLQLAEHRHRGIDFVWTAQGPNQIYPFARPLIADHTHVVRRFGTQFIDVFKWEELQEDVKSDGKRSNALRNTRTLPEQAFGAYKSAEVHTIKRRIPWRVVALPGLLIAAVLAAWFAFHALRPANLVGSTDEATGASVLAPAPTSATGARGASPEDREPMTALEYAAAHLPRFATMPHTAPIFDDRAPTADPLLMCMSSEAGTGAAGEHLPASCICLTEQGTKYDISDGECRRVARWGQPYNPYRERSDRRMSGDRMQVNAGAGRSELPVYQGGTPGTVGAPGVDRTFGTLTRPIP